MASEQEQQRIVLLNHLRSRSVSRAPSEYQPPSLSGLELVLGIIKRGKHAIEFEDLVERDGWTDDQRLAAGRLYRALRLRRTQFDPPSRKAPGYAVLLFELLEPDRRTFQVVDVDTFRGRELAAERSEAGSLSAHVVVRFPPEGGYDNGMYRCAIETASPITRSRIESFLNRQIRRLAPEWTFQVEIPLKRKVKTKTYQYVPKLELLADVARALPAASEGDRFLSHLIFTKRGEMQSIGTRSHVKERDFHADVTLRINAKEGPEDEAERVNWAAELRTWYEFRGYKAKIFFRNSVGGVLGGKMHHQIEGAQDLLLCPKEFIPKPENFKPWCDRIDASTTADMKELLEKDELWEHTK